MTFRIPRWVFIGGGAFIVMAALSFSITEWRLQGTDAVCTVGAMEDFVSGSEAVLDDRPVYPLAPSSLASDTAWESYARDFDRYERDFRAWQEQGDVIQRDYIAAVRGCL